MRMRAKAPGAEAPGRGITPGALLWRHLCGRYEGCVLEYLRSLTACRRRLSRPAVHRLRVAIRRLLACLELLRAAGRKFPSVRRDLKSQLGALGALRDTQVQLKVIRSEPQYGDALRPLVRRLRRLRRSEAKAARKAVKGAKTLRLLDQFDPGPAPGSARETMRLREFIEAGLHQTAMSLSSLSSPAHAGSAKRHRARKRLRRFYFVMEALKPVWHGDKDGKLSSSVRDCQGAIGQIHDREILLRKVGRLVSEGRIPRTSARPFCDRLKSEKTGQLKACGPLVRRARDASYAQR